MRTTEVCRYMFHTTWNPGRISDYCFFCPLINFGDTSSSSVIALPFFSRQQLFLFGSMALLMLWEYTSALSLERYLLTMRSLWCFWKFPALHSFWRKIKLEMSVKHLDSCTLFWANKRKFKLCCPLILFYVWI